MTQQIARAILIATCATILLAGVAAYFAVRQVIIQELDQLLIERAALVLREVGMGEDDPLRRVPQGDRYLIRTDAGRTIARPPSDRAAPVLPVVTSRGFADTAEGGRVRTLTLRWMPPSRQPAVTIIYSTPATAYHSALRSLGISLTVVTLAGLMLTALVARRAARRAMRPLARTADAIGSIDERNLARRIEVTSLPLELAPVAQRLNEMLDRIESAFGRQKQFLIDAAHELRTPVAALRTTIEVAMEGRRDQASMARSLERCLGNAKLLERIAAQLTDSLRQQDAHATEVREPVNVSRVVSDCVSALQPLAVAKNQQLAARTDSTCLILCDIDKLTSIVINLLSNAIEYTPAGGRIDVESALINGEWRLLVRDTGVGIAHEHLDRLFDPFFRVDRARNRERSHLGLGLYMVKAHVESLGGEIRVQSAPSRGSVFTVSIKAHSLPGEKDEGLPAPLERAAIAPDVISRSLQDRRV